MVVWPRDLCYVRYWRRNDDGSYVVLFRSRGHENCGPQPGYVRAHIESRGYNISPLKPRNGRPRTQDYVNGLLNQSNMSSASVSSRQNQRLNKSSVHFEENSANRNSVMIDEHSDEDEEFQIAEAEQEAYQNAQQSDLKKPVIEEPAAQIDLSWFSGNLRHDDCDSARDCWKISDGNNFSVRSKALL